MSKPIENNKSNEGAHNNAKKRIKCKNCPYVEYRDEINIFCGVCHRDIYAELRQKQKKKEGSSEK